MRLCTCQSVAEDASELLRTAMAAHRAVCVALTAVSAVGAAILTPDHCKQHSAVG